MSIGFNTILINLFPPYHREEIPEDEKRWLLRIFQLEYYPDATIEQHLPYLEGMHECLGRFGRLPTPRELFLRMRRLCFCEYMVSDAEYTRACQFLLRTTGEALDSSCAHYYYHAEFYQSEGRDPDSFQVLDQYIEVMTMIQSNPERIFDLYNEICSTPSPHEVVQHLRKSITTISDKGCSICQEDISHQRAITLKCGHSFHSDQEDCCETGTIFTWMDNNPGCPVCRSVISL